MKNFESLNKEFARNRVVRKGVSTEGLTFAVNGAKLKDYQGAEFLVDGFFLTNDPFGNKQVVVVADNHLINMPQRAVEQFENILADDELSSMVENGNLHIRVGELKKCKQGTTVLYELKTVA